MLVLLVLAIVSVVSTFSPGFPVLARCIATRPGTVMLAPFPFRHALKRRTESLS